MGAFDRFRAENPAYEKWGDAELADGLYQKFYAGKMPRDEFNRKVGYEDPTVLERGGRQIVDPIEYDDTTGDEFADYASADKLVDSYNDQLLQPVEVTARRRSPIEEIQVTAKRRGNASGFFDETEQDRATLLAMNGQDPEVSYEDGRTDGRTPIVDDVARGWHQGIAGQHMGEAARLTEREAELAGNNLTQRPGGMIQNDDPRNGLSINDIPGATPLVRGWEAANRAAWWAAGGDYTDPYYDIDTHKPIFGPVEARRRPGDGPKMARTDIPSEEDIAYQRQDVADQKSEAMLAGAQRQRWAAANPPSEAQQRFMQSKGWGEAWDRFKEAPVDIATGIASESMGLNAAQPSNALVMVPGIGGVARGVIAGFGSYQMEYGGSLLSSAQKAGFDLSSVRGFQQGLSDPARVAAWRDHAAAEGIAPAIFDGISAGVAGKLVGAAKTGRGKVGAAAVEGFGVQPGLGMVGEAGKVAFTGEMSSAADILAEGLGEIPTGAIETATGAYEQGMNNRAQEGEGSMWFPKSLGTPIAPVDPAAVELGQFTGLDPTTDAAQAPAAPPPAPNDIGAEIDAVVDDPRPIEDIIAADQEGAGQPPTPPPSAPPAIEPPPQAPGLSGIGMQPPAENNAPIFQMGQPVFISSPDWDEPVQGKIDAIGTIVVDDEEVPYVRVLDLVGNVLYDGPQDDVLLEPDDSAAPPVAPAPDNGMFPGGTNEAAPLPPPGADPNAPPPAPGAGPNPPQPTAPALSVDEQIGKDFDDIFADDDDAGDPPPPAAPIAPPAAGSAPRSPLDVTPNVPGQPNNVAGPAAGNAPQEPTEAKNPVSGTGNAPKSPLDVTPNVSTNPQNLSTDQQIGKDFDDIFADDDDAGDPPPTSGTPSAPWSDERRQDATERARKLAARIDMNRLEIQHLSGSAFAAAKQDEILDFIDDDKEAIKELADLYNEVARDAGKATAKEIFGITGASRFHADTEGFSKVDEEAAIQKKLQELTDWFQKNPWLYIEGQYSPEQYRAAATIMFREHVGPKDAMTRMLWQSKRSNSAPDAANGNEGGQPPKAPTNPPAKKFKVSRTRGLSFWESVAKAGGLDPKLRIEMGLDPKHNPRLFGAGNLFREGGMDQDALTEFATEQGWVPPADNNYWADWHDVSQKLVQDINATDSNGIRGTGARVFHEEDTVAHIEKQDKSRDKVIKQYADEARDYIREALGSPDSVFPDEDLALTDDEITDVGTIMYDLHLDVEEAIARLLADIRSRLEVEWNYGDGSDVSGADPNHNQNYFPGWDDENDNYQGPGSEAQNGSQPDAKGNDGDGEGVSGQSSEGGDKPQGAKAPDRTGEAGGSGAAPGKDPVDDELRSFGWDDLVQKRLVETFLKKLKDGHKFKSIVEARKLAENTLGRPIPKGRSLRGKMVEEAFEEALVQAAREITNDPDASVRNKMERLFALYEQQPILGTRTGDSIARQAYSTPAPLAYLASVLARVSSSSVVLEPTAGNGMLLIEANPDDAVVNELDDARLQTLSRLGFKNATQKDATEDGAFEENSADVVIANPPFGVTKDENLDDVVFHLPEIAPNFKTKQIDQVISFNALSALRPNGSAVLILGGLKSSVKGDQARADAYHAGNKREFYALLNKHYNVVDMFTLPGEFYARQGAGWPIDVIVIDGDARSGANGLPDFELPSMTAPRIIEPTVEGFMGVLNEHAARLNLLDAESGDVSNTTTPGNRMGAGNAGNGGRDQGGAGSQDIQHGNGNGPRGSGGNGAGSPAGDGAGSGRGGGDGRGGQSGTSRDERTDAPNLAGSRDGSGRSGDEPAGAGSAGGPGNTTGPDTRNAADKSIDELSDDELAKLIEDIAKNNGTTTRSNSPAQDDAFERFVNNSVPDESLPQDVTVEEGRYIKMKAVLDRAVARMREIGPIPEAAGAFLQGLIAYLKEKASATEEKVVKATKMIMRYAREFVVGEKAAREAEEARRKSEEEKRKARIEAAQNNSLQVPYIPKSKAGAADTLMPINMRTAIEASLNKIEERVGDIDAYVAEQLGMELSDKEGGLLNVFFAEQIDAIALAMNSLNEQAGFIIGDQTGIGKGRVVAAMIRYAMRQGLIPVFVTEKDNLYAAMGEDLHAVGLGNIRILITDNGKRFSAEIGPDLEFKIQTPPKHQHEPVLAEEAAFAKANGRLKNYDVIFTTYNQMSRALQEDGKGGKAADDSAAVEKIITGGKNSGGGKKGGAQSLRRTLLESVLENGFLIMDESHNAGGTEESKSAKKKKKDEGENRARFFRRMVRTASSVFYSSATWAKRPGVMDLYAATDLKKISSNLSKIGEIISFGGVPMQQVVAMMLTEVGQYIRRERSFDGVEYNVAQTPVDRKAFDDAATVYRGINQFYRQFVEPYVMAKNIQSRNEGELTGNLKSVTLYDSTGFAALLHNLVSQMTLAAKTENIVKEVKASLARGEKPVIALANTMGSMIEDLKEQNNWQPGEKVAVTFNMVLERYLERQLRMTVKEPGQKSKVVEIPIGALGPAAEAAFNQLRKAIQDAHMPSVPLSPIDMIKARLAQEGIRVGEITGRKHTIEYQADGTGIYRARSAKEIKGQGKIETINKFNGGRRKRSDKEDVNIDGTLDVLILNQSGATGISLHAGKNFGDRRRRHMIVAQPEANIDTHMQMLGRIHRSGQIVLPRYTQLIADVPAEIRPASVLLKKMKSLNANTTGGTKSAFEDDSIVDFLNPFGDYVVGQIALENPDLIHRMERPKLLKYVDEQFKAEEDAARKFSGAVSFLPIEEQFYAMDLLAERYKTLIEELDQAGLNTLEAKIIDYDAVLVSSQQIMDGKGGQNASPFDAGAYANVYDVRMTTPPLTTERAFGLMRTAVRDIADETTSIPDSSLNMSEAEVTEFYAEAKRLGERTIAQPIKDNETAEKEAVKASEKEQAEADARIIEIKKDIKETPWVIPVGEDGKPKKGAAAKDPRLGMIDVLEAEKEKEKAQLATLKQRIKAINALLKVAFTGAPITLKSASGNVHGIVLSIKMPKPGGNRFLGSQWKAKMMLETGDIYELSFSSMSVDEKDEATFLLTPSRMTVKDILAQAEMRARRTREEKIIIVGNLPAAFSEVKGRVINFLDRDGKLISGILPNEGYKIAEIKRDIKTVGDAFEQLEARLPLDEGREGLSISYQGVQNPDGTMSKISEGLGTITIRFSSAKAGGRFYLLPAAKKLFPNSVVFNNKNESMDQIPASRHADFEAFLVEVFKADGSFLRYKSSLNKFTDIAEKRAAELSGKTTTTSNMPAGFQNAIPAGVRTDIEREVIRIIMQMAPHARVEFDNGTQHKGVAGETVKTYNNVWGKIVDPVIRIIFGTDKDKDSEAIGTAYHEVLHALRSFFTPQQWAVLMREAPKWAKQFKVAQRWANHVGQTGQNRNDALAEEAAAEALRHYMLGLFNPKGPIQVVFARIARFFGRVRNLLAGYGYQTWEDVFEKVASGEIAKQPEALGRSTINGEIELQLQKAEVSALAKAMNKVIPDVVRNAWSGVEAPIALRIDDPSATRPDSMNILTRMGVPPLQAFKKWPALQALVRKGVQAEINQSVWAARLREQYEKIRGTISVDDWAGVLEALWQGDADQLNYTENELRGFFQFNDAQVKAFQDTRNLIEKVGRMVDQHRRAMLPAVRQRKMQVLRMLTELMRSHRVMSDAAFKKSYNRRLYLLTKLKSGKGDAVAIQAEIDQINAQLALIRFADPILQERAEKLQDELAALDQRLAATSVRRKVGYVPHKFFGSWRLYEKTGVNEETREDEWREITSDQGFYDSRSDAIAAAAEYAAKNPNAEMKIEPKSITFPATADGVQLSDKAYLRLRLNLEKEAGLQGQDLLDVLKGAARKRFRRRIYGASLRRYGAKGFSDDLDRVMYAHIGQAVRYVNMDKMKFEMVNTIERMGLSPYKQLTQDQKQLQAAAENWWRDINGQKQPGEESVDDLLNKTWMTPMRGAMITAISAAALLGAYTNPLVGLPLGGWFGYRMYQALEHGGEFKTRHFTGALVGDMAHLKLGAFVNISSAMVNMTQLALNTYPVLGEKWLAAGTRRAAKAFWDLRAKRETADTVLMERADIKTAWHQSEKSPGLFEKESQLATASMFMFQGVETINRAVTFFGALSRAEAAGKTPGAAKREAMAVVNRTQFHYGAANKPELLRSALLRVPLQFKNYLAQQVTFVFGLRGPELPRFLLASMMVGGVLGLPTDLPDWLLQKMFGWSFIEWFKGKMIDALAFGDVAGTAATVFARGLPALLGVDISSRVALTQNAVPKTLTDAFGPWGGTISSLKDMAENDATLADWLRSIATGPGNALKSLEAAANGMPTPRLAARALGLEDGPTGLGDGTAILTNPRLKGAEEYRPTTGELTAKALGFRPIREAQLGDVRELGDAQTERRQTKVRKYLARAVEAQRAGDTKAFEEAIKDAEAAGYPLTKDQIRRAMKDSYTPRDIREMKSTPKPLRPEVNRRRELVEEAYQ